MLEVRWVPHFSPSERQSWKGSNRSGLLLRQAMQRAEAEDKVAAGNANDFAAGKERGESVEGHAIVGVVERGDDDKFVGDIKIGVAGRKALIIEINWGGHGKSFNAERAAVQVFHGLQQLVDFLQGDVIGVMGILFDDGDDGGGADEAGEIVDMAVRVVAGDSIFQPENLGDSEIAAEDVSVIFAGESVIALLALAEQAFFGGEQGAAAVDVDAAAFEHDAAALVDGLPGEALELFIYVGDGEGVFFVVLVLSPPVEEPVRVGDFAGTASHADGTGVAHPAAIGRDTKKVDSGEVHAGLFQDVARTRFRSAILNEQIDALNAREVANDFGIGPGNRGKFAGPVSLFVGPAEPGGFVMLPLGRHPETTFERSGTARGCGHVDYSPSQRFKMGP